MLQAARVIVRCYAELAPPLAAAHAIPYPAALARMMSDRLEQVGSAPAKNTSERRADRDRANA